MSKMSENILDKCRESGLATPSGGRSVPEGYFADFTQRMAGLLPDRPELERPEEYFASQRRTFWQKVRPYVYMAAMFAGIWLMLQMFNMMGNAGKLEPMEDNAVLAEAFSNDEFIYDYIYADVDSWELVDQYIDPDVDFDSYDFEYLSTI